jgi:CheY-like chemotaxis protein
MLNKQDILDSVILILDDEPANTRLLEKILKGAAGYCRVYTLNDSRKAQRLNSDIQPD